MRTPCTKQFLTEAQLPQLRGNLLLMRQHDSVSRWVKPLQAHRQCATQLDSNLLYYGSTMMVVLTTQAYRPGTATVTCQHTSCMTINHHVTCCTVHHATRTTW
jgi:hypothetical protein